MQKKALVDYLTQNSHPLRDEDITVIPLEGEGKVDERVDKLATSLTSRSDWLAALAEADAIFLTTHSQGSIVLTQLLARLIDQGKVEGRKCSLLCLAAISQGPLASLVRIVNHSGSDVCALFDRPERKSFQFGLF